MRFPPSSLFFQAGKTCVEGGRLSTGTMPRRDWSGCLAAWRRGLIVALVFLFAGLLPQAAEAAPAESPLRLEAPEQAPQGSAILVRASVPALLDDRPQITFFWLKKSLEVPAIPVGDRWEAEVLLPMPVDMGGRPIVRALARTPNGRANATARIRAVPVKWPQQQISVNKKYVSPPANVQKRIARERQISAAALAHVEPERAWSGDFVRPVPGVITSAFGGKRMFNGQTRSYHRGVDLRGAEGTPIKALDAGKVVIAQDMYYAGQVVYVDHGQGVISLYCHMSAMDVKAGDEVEAGQVIGRVGSTGRVTGPHLHLGLIILGQAVDPLSLFDLDLSRNPGE